VLASLPVWLVVGSWALLGAMVGAGVRAANVRLAGAEGLDAGGRLWQRGGPVLVTAVLFGALALQLGVQPMLVVRSLWLAVLVQITFFDAEHHLVLDRVLVPAGMAAVMLSLVTPGVGWQSSLIAGAVAGAVFLAIALGGALLLRTEALGMGDVKLAAFVGLMLGVGYAATGLVAGVVLAGLVAMALVVVRVRRVRDGIAYGPYLAAGAILSLFLAGAVR
jgi:prepilin signal peptidase PulO-like enzyme (type II secretory pathway)